MEEYGLNQTQTLMMTASINQANYFEEAVKLGKKHHLHPKTIANYLINKRLDPKMSLTQFIQAMVKQQKKPQIPAKELNQAINQVFRTNPKATKDYHQGKRTAIEFLLGQVMRQTEGRADPNLTRKILLEKIKAKR